MPQQPSPPASPLESSGATHSTVMEAAASRLSLSTTPDTSRNSKESADGGAAGDQSPSSSVDGQQSAGQRNGINGGNHNPTSGSSTAVFEKPVQTKVYYYIDEQETPYLTHVDVPPEHITLEDFKRGRERRNFKYYCKTIDRDTGNEVKEELMDDHQQLTRSANGNFELYLITIEGSSHSDGSHGAMRRERHHMVPGPAPSAGYGGYGIRPYPGGHPFDNTMSTETDSMASGHMMAGFKGQYVGGSHHEFRHRHANMPPAHHYVPAQGHRARGRYDDSTLGSESDARVFSDEDDRVSTSTDITSVSRQHERMVRRRRQAPRHHRRPSRASSFSSITESSMSLHVETVTLNMDTVNFLGISIVGQSSASGDNGIYVANVMKGGAVALDGRIESGDMILQVNDIAFDNFTNDQAVDVLREAVERKGPIKLTVAKSLDHAPRSCFTIPRQVYNHRDEPVRPIDTGAWIQHTNAMRGMPSILEGSEGAPTPLPGDGPRSSAQQRPASSSTATSTGSNGQNTMIGQRLDINTDKRRVVEAMVCSGSGLDIKNRTWLKISIPMSFLGSDLVDWLLEHVEGLRERKDGRKYAAEMLRQRLIAHVVNKITFTEQCYYVLGEQCAELARYRALAEEAGQPSGGVQSWQWTVNATGGGGVSGLVPGPKPTVGGSMVSGYASMPMSPLPHFGATAISRQATVPAPDIHSQVSDGSGGSGAERRGRSNRPVVIPPGPSSSTHARLDELPTDLASSRQSFRLAMNHPYEFFVDNL